jgi:UDP-N-acetyl-D-mannosaminuronate dehydrogenase
MQRIGLLGFGEIGQAVYKVYQETGRAYKILVKDLNRDDGLLNVDVLNVAIPYSDKFDFVSEVVNVANSSNAKAVIIHSTVAVGTTRRIKSYLDSGTSIAHSPCRGVHPYLYEGLKTFTKFVGSPEGSDASVVAEHLKSLGINTHICKNSETSELAKLLDTSYYGVCIAFHGEAEKACRQFGADFDDVMTAYNNSYNEGYTLLGKSNVVRPVLTPPKGGIGGHCVVQNAELLKKQFESSALDLILSHKKEQL